MKLPGIIFIIVGCAMVISFLLRFTLVTNWYIRNVSLFQKDVSLWRIMFIIIGCLCIVAGVIIILYGIDIKLPWY